MSKLKDGLFMDATAVLTGQMWSSNNSEQTKCDQLTVGESTSVHFCLKKKKAPTQAFTQTLLSTV